MIQFYSRIESPGWGTAEVYHGDCREIIPRRGEIPKDEGQLWRDRFDLIFADPPFNIGHPYRGFMDRLATSEHRQFTRAWIHWCGWALRPGGRLCVHVPDEMVEMVWDAVVYRGGISRSDWIIWHYRFGQHKDTGPIRSKAHLLTFIKDGGDSVWNLDAVAVPSDRASKYGDKRTLATKRPGLRPPLDVWGIPSDGECWGRVQGNNAERRKGHPNQLPEKYLERVILAWSNPGGSVLDPFGGSGTTAVVASALGREAVTIEISGDSCRSIVERLKQGPVRLRRSDHGKAKEKECPQAATQGQEKAGQKRVGGERSRPG